MLVPQPTASSPHVSSRCSHIPSFAPLFDAVPSPARCTQGDVSSHTELIFFTGAFLYSGDLMSLPSRSRLYVHLAAASASRGCFLLHSLSCFEPCFSYWNACLRCVGRAMKWELPLEPCLRWRSPSSRSHAHMLHAHTVSFVLFLFHITVSLFSHFSLFQKAVRCVPNNAPQCAFSH